MAPQGGDRDVEIQVGIDLGQLESELGDAEQRLRQGLERMNALAQQQTPPPASTLPLAPPQPETETASFPTVQPTASPDIPNNWARVMLPQSGAEELPQLQQLQPPEFPQVPPLPEPQTPARLPDVPESLAGQFPAQIFEPTPDEQTVAAVQAIAPAPDEQTVAAVQAIAPAPDPQTFQTPSAIAPPQPSPETGKVDPRLEKLYSDFAKVQAIAPTAPDAALRAASGIQNRAANLAAKDPEQAEAVQKLIDALKDLTKGIKDSDSKDSDTKDPVSQLMGFAKANAFLQVGQQAAGNLMGGNVLGAGGNLLGGAIGMALGGPVGMAAGSALLGGLGAGAQGLLGAGGARGYMQSAYGIEARLGEFDSLSLDNVSSMNTSGYSPEQTLAIFDQLRQQNVIDSVGEEEKQLVESLQEMSRATGINTEALTNLYASNEALLAGDRSADSYMATVLEGAIAAGFEGNVQQYAELLNSSTTQLVYGSGQQADDETLKKLNNTIAVLTGGQSSTSELFRDNPMLAQQAMSTLLATGSAKPYSYEATAMQLAGVHRADINEAFTDPSKQVDNALIRNVSVLENLLSGGGMQLLGAGSMEELQAAASQDPDFLRKMFSSENPNKEQAAALQDLFNMQFKGQYGRDASSTDTNLFFQIASSFLANQGQIGSDSVTASGEETLAELINQSSETDAQKALDAANERHEALLQLQDEVKNFQTMVDRFMTVVIEDVGEIAEFIKTLSQKVSAFIGAQPLQQVSSTINSVVDGTTSTLQNLSKPISTSLKWLDRALDRDDKEEDDDDKERQRRSGGLFGRGDRTEQNTSEGGNPFSRVLNTIGNIAAPTIGGSPTIAVNNTFNLGGNSDRATVQQAAADGTQSALDAFTQRDRQGSSYSTVDPRGRSRISGSAF